ncbi:CBS domain-containing protein [Actinokineospora sp. PR83]|uniref:CBS domain-containing protein n=1 Tax=Actinokineospora sp. PR83 TaxID=2884908 RepID=UPI001F17D29B|nr:CBS domain-containing protein [Actinokineospora sp. PR83]MCG8915549.1 CBS domain-containing protein [Actinokineospora sp. PR83]
MTGELLGPRTTHDPGGSGDPADRPGEAMRVRDVMTRPVVTVRPETPLRQAVTLVTECGYAGLPVVDDAGRVTGVVGESELLRCVAAPGLGADRAVGEVMVRPVEVVGPDAEVTAVVDTMLATGTRCLPVVERGLLVGVLARRDLLRTLVRTDDVVQAKVRALLDDYAGSRRGWTLAVVDGAVTVSGDFADDAERGLVVALCRTVAGVRSVHLDPIPASALAWDD